MRDIYITSTDFEYYAQSVVLLASVRARVRLGVEKPKIERNGTALQERRKAPARGGASDSEYGCESGSWSRCVRLNAIAREWGLVRGAVRRAVRLDTGLRHRDRRVEVMPAMRRASQEVV
jgi:hypothetical protein